MTMLRIDERTKAVLRALAEQRGEPMFRVVEELVEPAKTEQFFAAADAAYQRLRADSDAWRSASGVLVVVPLTSVSRGIPWRVRVAPAECQRPA